MHRSSSNSLDSDQFFSDSSPALNARQSIDTDLHKQQQQQLLLQDDRLPTYDPLSLAAKIERSRIRSAEHFVHVIPLILVLCAMILWFCSNSDTVINVVKKGD